jgi:hypothetical protein
MHPRRYVIFPHCWGEHYSTPLLFTTTYNDCTEYLLVELNFQIIESFSSVN